MEIFVNNTNQDYEKEVDTLVEFLYSHFREHPEDIPHFPAVITQLIQCLEDENVEAKRVQDIILKDAAISAKVIAASNSSIFSGLEKVDSVQNAIVRLGFRETNDIAMAVGFHTFFHDDTKASVQLYQEIRSDFFDYSMIMAYGTKFIGSYFKRQKPEILFLSGLFHDVGKILILQALSSAVIKKSFPFEITEEHIFEMFEEFHSELGAEFLVKNRIPADVIQSTLEHHKEELSLANETLSTHFLRIASGVTSDLGYFPLSDFYQENEVQPEFAQSVEKLLLDTSTLSYFRNEFKKINKDVMNIKELIKSDTQNVHVIKTVDGEKPLSVTKKRKW